MDVGESWSDAPPRIAPTDTDRRRPGDNAEVEVGEPNAKAPVLMGINVEPELIVSLSISNTPWSSSFDDDAEDDEDDADDESDDGEDEILTSVSS